MFKNFSLFLDTARAIIGNEGGLLYGGLLLAVSKHIHLHAMPSIQFIASDKEEALRVAKNTMSMADPIKTRIHSTEEPPEFKPGSMYLITSSISQSLDYNILKIFIPPANFVRNYALEISRLIDFPDISEGEADKMRRYMRVFLADNYPESLAIAMSGVVLGTLEQVKCADRFCSKYIGELETIQENKSTY